MFDFNSLTRPTSSQTEQTQNRTTSTTSTSQGTSFSTDSTSLGGLTTSSGGFSSLLELIRQLIEQLGLGQTPTPPGPTPPGPTPPGPTPPSPTPPSPTPPGPTPPGPTPPGPTPPGPTPSVTLTSSERNILQSLFATDARGNEINGANLSVTDGSSTNGSGRLNIGDTVSVKDADGNTINEKTLTADDLYDLRFRENMIDNISSLNGGGWSFTGDLANMPFNRLYPPQTRSYENGVETVTARNDYWEIVQRGPYDTNHLLMRETDDQGNPVKPSDAINDIFENRNRYQFDCATPMPLLNMKTTLDTVGADDFDRQAGQMLFSSWYDQYDYSNNDGGYDIRLRQADAGDIVVDGVANLDGETALFDPARGERLEIGSTYYFDKPGDDSSAAQGWNAVYLGQRDDGSHDFWAISKGEVNVTFDEGTWVANSGFNNHYLGAVIADPNIDRIQNWDQNTSVD